MHDPLVQSHYGMTEWCIYQYAAMPSGTPQCMSIPEHRTPGREAGTNFNFRLLPPFALQ